MVSIPDGTATPLGRSSTAKGAVVVDGGTAIEVEVDADVVDVVGRLSMRAAATSRVSPPVT